MLYAAVLCHILFPFRHLTHFDRDRQNEQKQEKTRQRKHLFKSSLSFIFREYSVLKQHLHTTQKDSIYLNYHFKKSTQVKKAPIMRLNTTLSNRSGLFCRFNRLR